MTLTQEQVDFLTTGNPDTQTGLPEPEHTIQVIRSLNENGEYGIDYEHLIITLGTVDTCYVARFNTIGEMYDYVANTIG